MTEMEQRGEQAGRDRPQRKRKGNEAERLALGQNPQWRQDAQKSQQSIAGAGSGREDDDGKRGMHEFSNTVTAWAVTGSTGDPASPADRPARRSQARPRPARRRRRRFGGGGGAGG